MIVKFPKFEDSLVENGKKSMISRGKNFCDKNLIQHVHAHSGNEWDVFVQSEERSNPGYTTKVKIKGNKVGYIHCTCIGFSHSSMCKHIVASLYAIRDRNLYDSDVDEEEARQNENKSKHKNVLVERREQIKNVKHETENTNRPITNNTKNIGIKSPLTRELECQECHNQLNNPVMMACQSHSICLGCVEGLLEKVKPNKDGIRELACTVCGEKSGLMKINNLNNIKLNQEMERIIMAYDQERRSWLQKKQDLESRIEELSASSRGQLRSEKKMKKEENLSTQERDSEVNELGPKRSKEEVEEDFFGFKKEHQKMDEERKSRSDVHTNNDSSLGKRSAESELDQEDEEARRNYKGHNLRSSHGVTNYVE